MFFSSFLYGSHSFSRNGISKFENQNLTTSFTRIKLFSASAGFTFTEFHVYKANKQ